MARKDKPGTISVDYYKFLRARFAGKADPVVAPLVAQAPADPTPVWFGAQIADDEPVAARRFDASGLRADADALAAHIQKRGDAEIALGAYGARAGIGALWLVIAAILFTVPTGADSGVLAGLFALIAGAGIGAALLGAIFTMLVARPGARRIKADGAALGQHIARETHALSDNLESGYNAVEADTFLKNVTFADGGEYAGDGFARYLQRQPSPDKSANARAGSLFITALAIAAGIAAIIAPSLGLPLPAIASLYPLAFAAIIAGAILYAGAGAIAAGFGTTARLARESRARDDALEALQAGFAEASAPSIASLAARIHPKQTHAPQASSARPEYAAPLDPHFRSGTPADSVPDWRVRDSGPQFVDTGFQAAPKSFRVDAGAKKNHKKNR